MLLAFALQAALSAVPPAPPPAADPFGERAFAQFSRAPLLANTGESVDVAASSVARSTKRVDYTLRLTRRHGSQVDTIAWIESGSCPAVRPVLAAMRAVTMPHPYVPAMDAPGAMVVDGTEYRLRAEAGFAQGRPGWIDLGSNVGTPLATWIDHSLAALESCWSSEQPHRQE